MAGQNILALKDWFGNCRSRKPRHDLATLQRGIVEGMINVQDEYGMTALSLCVTSDWKEGVVELLSSGADTELRYFRTGETALYWAVQKGNEAIVAALVAAGANPDAPNYCGVTARMWASRGGSTCFAHIPPMLLPLPPSRLQNVEHLAEHYFPGFEIPGRVKREMMKVGEAVDLYVYGPKTEARQDSLKVRITGVHGSPPTVRYTAIIETPIEQTHLAGSTSALEFGPENIASVYTTLPP